MPCCRRKEPEAVIGLKPYRERSCTDVLMLIAFIVAWTGLGYVCRLAINKGDPHRLDYQHGINMVGEQCGSDVNGSTTPYAAWPHPLYYDYMICVTSCADTTSDSRMVFQYPSTPVYYYCVPSNLTQLAEIASTSSNPLVASSSHQALVAIGDIKTSYPVIAGSIGITIGLTLIYLFLLRYFAKLVVWGLILLIMMAGGVGGWSILKRAQDELDDPYGDHDTGHMMQYLAYTLIGLTVLYGLIVLLLRKHIRIGIAVVIEASRAVTAIPTLLLVPILPLSMFCLFFTGWIAMSLYFYSVGSYNRSDTPSDLKTTKFPIPGSPTNLPDDSYLFQWDTTFQTYFLFHAFMLLWGTQAIIYFAYMVLSGAVADWYFAPKSADHRREVAEVELAAHQAHHPQQSQQQNDRRGSHAGTSKLAWPTDNTNRDHSASVLAAQSISVQPRKDASLAVVENHHKMSPTPVISSLARTTRFHIGTILVGALLIAILQAIRAVLTYIEKRSAARTNALQRALFCCVQCCLKCFQECVNKLNKNALIWSSIWGDNFVTSVCASFKLIWGNLLSASAMTLVGDVLLALCKAMVACGTTALCMLILQQVEPYKTDVSNVVAPCVVIFFLSYTLTSVFMMVAHTAIDTIFICFLVDEKYNGKGVMLASPELRSLVQSVSKPRKNDASVAPDGGGGGTKGDPADD